MYILTVVCNTLRCASSLNSVAGDFAMISSFSAPFSIEFSRLFQAAKKCAILTIASISCSCVFTLSALADDQEALTFDTIGTGSDYYQGSYSLGWRFKATSALRITALGFYDDSRNGLAASHDVGIYEVGTCQLIASTTVSPSDPLEGTGFFRYHAITPVTLTAGSDYYVAGLTNGGDRYAISVSTMVPNPAINYYGFVIFGNTQSTNSLKCPDGVDAPGFNGDYGPNFKFGDSTGGSPTPTATPDNGKRPTKITLFCNRKGVLLEQASCSATVADASTSFPRITPTGSIDFASTNGFFPASSSCNPVKPELSPTGIAACTVEFQVPNGFPIGSAFPINATYNGDANFNKSSTAHELFNVGCVGTPENPCPGAVSLSFGGEGLQILKTILKAVVGCGTTAGMAQATTEEITQEADLIGCGIGINSSVSLAPMLHELGLTPELCAQLSAAITSADANSDVTLKSLKEMFKKAGNDESYLQRIDANESILNAEITKIIRKNQKEDRRLAVSPDRANVGAATKTKSVVFATGFGKVAANFEKSINLKLTNFGKRFIKALKKSGIGTLPISFTLKSTRIGLVPSGVQKKVTTSGSVDVTF